jgi:predicted metalloprotease with PDZ domain
LPERVKDGAMKSQVWYYHHLLIVLVSALLSPPTNAFIPTSTRQLLSSFIVRQSNSANNPKTPTQLQNSLKAPAPKEAFPTAQFYNFDMPEHRPLGCTIEETLDPTEEYVFVSKVVPGGFADQAGIQIGDVVVAVTGLFGDVTTIVLESGVEKM